MLGNNILKEQQNIKQNKRTQCKITRHNRGKKKNGKKKRKKNQFARPWLG